MRRNGIDSVDSGPVPGLSLNIGGSGAGIVIPPSLRSIIKFTSGEFDAEFGRKSGLGCMVESGCTKQKR